MPGADPGVPDGPTIFPSQGDADLESRGSKLGNLFVLATAAIALGACILLWVAVLWLPRSIRSILRDGGAYEDWRGGPPPGAVTRLGEGPHRLGLSWGGVCYSPDGSRLAAWSRFPDAGGEGDKHLHVLDTKTGEELCRIGLGLGASVAAFLPDGKRIRWVDSGGALHEWSLETRGQTRLLDGVTEGRDTGATISMDGRLLAVRLRMGPDGAPVRVEDLDRGETKSFLFGHRGHVEAMAFSRDGRLLVTGSQEEVCRVWDTTSGESLLEVKTGPVEAIAVAPDGDRFVTALGSGDRSGRMDSEVRSWSLEDGKELGRYPCAVGYPESLAFLPEADALLVAGQAGVAGVSPETGETRFLLSLPRIDAISPSRDGREFAVVLAGSVHLFAADGTSRFADEAHRVSPDCLAFSPDGRRLASASSDGTLRIWQVATAEQERRWDWRGRGAAYLSFSPTGGHLAGSRDRTRIWNVETGVVLLDLPGSPISLAKDVNASVRQGVGGEDAAAGSGSEASPLTAYRFSPDGDAIAIGDAEGRIRIYGLSDGTWRSILDGGDGAPLVIAFEPEGEEIVSLHAKGRVARVVIGTGKVSLAFEVHATDPVTPAAIAPGVDRLAYGDPAGSVHVWDLDNGREVSELAAHDSEVTHVRFLGAGRRLLSAAVQREGRFDFNEDHHRKPRYTVWDLTTGKPCQRLEVIDGMPVPVQALASTLDGSLLATGGNLSVHFHDVLSGDTIPSPLAYSVNSWALAFSPDGRTLASAGKDGVISLWDLDRTLGRR